MECPRCHGAAVKVRLYELLKNDGQSYVGAWHWAYCCTACGNVSDWLVEQNQQMARQAVTTDKRTRNAAAGAA